VAKVYYDTDADLAPIRGQRIAVVGYGIQGRAQALNLHDSGGDVTVGVRPGGESWRKAQEDGLKAAAVPEAVKGADLVLMLIPDEVQREVYEHDVAPNLKRGATLDFAHGFNIRFGRIQPRADLDVIMVAPKAPGRALREQFQKGSGVPALIAVHQDASGRAKQTALALAKGLGSTRVGVIETTFREETETDLFGEQADLCGGVSELIKKSYEVLVEAGYQPELAYFEVLHELKMIVDLIQAGGIEGMWNGVSNTAEYGGRTRGGRVIDDRVKESMRRLLRDIQEGSFAQDWVAEYEGGMRTLERLRKEGAELPIEKVGAEIRRMFAPPKSV